MHYKIKLFRQYSKKMSGFPSLSRSLKTPSKKAQRGVARANEQKVAQDAKDNIIFCQLDAIHRECLALEGGHTTWSYITEYLKKHEPKRYTPELVSMYDQWRQQRGIFLA